jgi:hypothetical protein
MHRLLEMRHGLVRRLAGAEDLAEQTFEGGTARGAAFVRTPSRAWAVANPESIATAPCHSLRASSSRPVAKARLPPA